MKNEDLLKESINLILNYNGRSVVVELKKYKTLVHVKQKVFDLFFPVKNNINIYLNNKNLDSLMNQPIGYIFSGQSLVNLKIVDEGIIKTPIKVVQKSKNSVYTTNKQTTNYNKRYFSLNNQSNNKNLSSLENNQLNSNKKHIPIIINSTKSSH